MSDEENKVVPFPTHKLNKMGKAPGAKHDSSSLNRRVTLVMSLLSTVLVATFLASQMNNSSDNLQKTTDRVLASVQSKAELDDDILLARKISRDSLRQPASRGHEPTAEEILRHGSELASLYALRFDDKGALIALKYQGPDGQKRNIRDREEFIRKNADLLKIKFERIAREPATENASKSDIEGERFEVYQLLDGDKTKAKVHFTLDADSKVTQMNVEVL